VHDCDIALTVTCRSTVSKPPIDFFLDPGNPAIAELKRLREFVDLTFPPEVVATIIYALLGPEPPEID
jgi:hypothetical protein